MLKFEFHKHFHAKHNKIYILKLCHLNFEMIWWLKP
jgi:hypothetical protein